MESYDSGRPLSFLDHRVKVGNSLIGATPELVREGIPDGALDPVGDDDKELAKRLKKRNREEKQQATFISGSSQMLVDWERVAENLASEARAIADLPDTAAAQVRAARDRYEQYEHGQLDPVRHRFDAWTAAFFWPIRSGQPPPPTTNDLRADSRGLPTGLSDVQTAEVHTHTRRNRFFHWELEFPEVFERKGFDCVLGNPPWERIKLQDQEFFADRDPLIASARNKNARDKLIRDLGATAIGRSLFVAFVDARRDAELASKFAQRSGRFVLTAVGDVNMYPLFAELDRSILAPNGVAGIVVPLGIATDDSTRLFFSELSRTRSIAKILGFENEGFIFPGVHHFTKFILLVMSKGTSPSADLSFFSRTLEQSHDERRHFRLRSDDFALLSPNTANCPTFRTEDDAELNRMIFSRVPVLVNEGTAANPWDISYRQGLFHSAADSDKFAGHTYQLLTERGATLSSNRFALNRQRFVPLCEGRMIWHYDHRAGTFAGLTERGKIQLPTPSESEHADPAFEVTPWYWVTDEEVERRLGAWPHDWLLGFRDVTNAVSERTAIFSLLPRVGILDQIGLVFPHRGESKLLLCLIGNLNSLVLDYCARQKVGGTHLKKYVLFQLPVFPPDIYSDTDQRFISDRVLELTYTADNVVGIAHEVGYMGPPFQWDERRRATIRGELDAYFAALYGLTRDELRYVLDPQDVHGLDFPSETFRVLKARETKLYGEYRTRRLVLEAWDRLGLEPRNRNGRYAGSPTTSVVEAAPPTPIVESTAAKTEVNGSVENLLAHQTVHERTRTPVRSMPLLPNRGGPPESTAAANPAAPAHMGHQAPTSPDPPLSPPSQPQLPGLSGGTVELRERVLKRSLDALRSSGPLSGREIAQRLGQLDKRIDRHLVNSVLGHEGAQFVRRDAVSGKYRIKTH